MPMLKEEVLTFVQGLKTISEPVRREALALARQQEQDPRLLNTRSTEILSALSERTPEEYRLAMKWAKEAHRLEPEAGDIANTLGVTLYYAGKYQEAAAALEQSLELNLKAGRDDQVAYDLLFQAMSQCKLGRQEEARAFLQRARDPKLSGMVSPRFWREAEALIEGKPNEPNK
jgi:tetratricopeptide (TPR) repeat protein